MGRARSMHGKLEIRTKLWLESQKGRTTRKTWALMGV
jgi:hypothetical protein